MTNKRPSAIFVCSNMSVLVILATVLLFAPTSAQAQSSESNVALGKPARQSSTKFGENAAARVAVDGNTNGNWAWSSANSVTHTFQDSPHPWWEVDLGGVYDISSIRIWNRTDCCRKRIDGMRILVGETPIRANDTRVFASEQSFGPADNRVFTSTRNNRGRYVRVALDRKQVLSLAEVEVFAKPVDSSSDNLITANSVGSIRLGMTIAEARRAISGGSFERDVDTDEYRVLVGDRVVMTLTPGETFIYDDEGNARPLNDDAKIESITVLDSRYRMVNGVHPRMKISEVEKTYGKAKLFWDPEGGESVKFANQPKHLEFKLSEQNRVGIYTVAGNPVPERDFGDLSKGFETSVYTPGTQVHSISVSGTGEAADRKMNYLLTENSAGDIRLGMTVAELRRLFPNAKFEQYDESEEGRWIEITLAGRTFPRLMTDQRYTEPDDQGLVPIDETAKVDIIEVSDSRYRSADGIHVGMKLSEAEKKFGKLKQIEYWGLDASEHPTFSGETKYSFQVDAADYATNNESRAGIYSDDDVRTTRYTPGAVISQITVGQGEPEDPPKPGATVNTPGDVLNMRLIPNHRTGLRVTQIPHRGRVTIEECESRAVRIGRRWGSWCRVTYQGMTGWVFDAWLDKDQEIEVPADGTAARKILWDFRAAEPEMKEFSKNETNTVFNYLFGGRWDRGLKLSSRVSGSFTRPNARQTLYYVSACELEPDSGVLSSQCPHVLWDTTGWIAIYEGTTPVMKIKAALGYNIVKTTDVNGDGINEILSLNTYSNHGITRTGGTLGQISGTGYKEIKRLSGSSNDCALADTSSSSEVTSVASYVPTANGKSPVFVEEYFKSGCDDSNWKKITRDQFDEDSVG